MDGTDGTTGEQDEKAGAVPSDLDLARERRAAAARAGLAAARAAKAAKSGKGSKGSKADADDAPAAPKASESGLLAGCEVLVRLCWMLASGAAYLGGGRLPALSAQDASEGAREALPLARRFAFLAAFLGFIGFPVWLGRKVGELFETRPAEVKAPAKG
jgi:hypothetical protein